MCSWCKRKGVKWRSAEARAAAHARWKQQDQEARRAAEMAQYPEEMRADTAEARQARAEYDRKNRPFVSRGGNPYAWIGQRGRI